MAREPWSTEARERAKTLAAGGVSRPNIVKALTAWARAEKHRVDMIVAAWADKLAGDAGAASALRTTRTHPRMTTRGGWTPPKVDDLTTSEVLRWLQEWLGQTTGIAERRPFVTAAVDALQTGLGEWPDMDAKGDARRVLE